MRPMLAATLQDLEDLEYPVYVSAKLDGVRALVHNGQLVSRSLKPIPNEYISKCLGHSLLDGVDGELIVGDPTARDVFTTTTSAVMSRNGEPNFKFFIHDVTNTELVASARLPALSDWFSRLRSKGIGLHLVHQNECWSLKEVREVYGLALLQGYEGIIIKGWNGKYKYGRSTVKEGHMMKYKPIEYREAIVISEFPMKGHPDRLGGYVCIDTVTKSIFKVGTGFTTQQRLDLLNSDSEGELIRYSHQGVGSNGAPRFPVFEGFRSSIDM